MPDHPETSATEAPGDVQPTADHPSDAAQAAREQWHAGGGSALAPDELPDGPRADHATPDVVTEEVSTEERERNNTPA